MADVNVHRTDQDFLNGNLEGSPRLRVNRTTSLSLSTTWQRIDFNGTSTSNTNTFPLASGQTYQTCRWDTVNKLFLFTDPVDRNYNLSLYYHIVSSGLFTNTAQMRFVVPNGISPGVNLYFPFPDDGGYKDLCNFAANTDNRVTDNTTVYINAAVRANGLGVEMKVQSTLILAQTASLSSIAMLIFGR